MKILIPHTISNSSSANPFVRVLHDQLVNLGHVVTCRSDLFWKSPLEYDLIWFQWPESILQSSNIKLELDNVVEQVEKIKKEGILICMTVHNLHPHVSKPFLSDLYEYLFSHVDAFHHMGEYSSNYLKDKFPSAFHFIAPHPTFYDVKDIGMSVDDCKAKYGINKKQITILAFGAFRNDDERNLLVGVKNRMGKQIRVWAPKIYSDSYSLNRKKNYILRMSSNLAKYLKYTLYGIKMHRGIIEDKEVLPMINAADILLIQRKDILNSGNLPLGFCAKKVVIGPDVGNVGQILKKTGNPVFDPNDITSVCNAIDLGINMYRNDNQQGIKNYKYSQENWSIDRVAEKIKEALQKISA